MCVKKWKFDDLQVIAKLFSIIPGKLFKLVEI